MKKLLSFALILALGASMLVGCGCMNTGNDVPTLPTNGETSAPTTRPTTAPTTMPTTAPTTEAATEGTTDSTDTTGVMDDIMGGSTDDTSLPSDAGRGRSFGGNPRMR